MKKRNTADQLERAEYMQRHGGDWVRALWRARPDQYFEEGEIIPETWINEGIFKNARLPKSARNELAQTVDAPRVLPQKHDRPARALPSHLGDGMKHGADKNIDMPKADPLTWKVDGVPVYNYYKTRIWVTEAEKEVPAIVLVTNDGHNHYLWNPEEES